MLLETKLRLTKNTYVILKILQVILMFAAIIKAEEAYEEEGRSYYIAYSFNLFINAIPLFLVAMKICVSIVLPLEFFNICLNAVIFSTGTFVEISNYNDTVREKFYNANHPKPPNIPVINIIRKYYPIEKTTTEELVEAISIVMTEKSELKNSLISYVDTHENSSELSINEHGASNAEREPTKESVDNFVVHYFYLVFILISFLCLIFHGIIIIVSFYYESLKKLDGSLINVEFHQTDDGEGVVYISNLSHEGSVSFSAGTGVSAHAVVSRSARNSDSSDITGSTVISSSNTPSTLSLGACVSHKNEEEEEEETSKSNINLLRDQQQQRILIEKQRPKERLGFLREQQMDISGSRKQEKETADSRKQEKEAADSRKQKKEAADSRKQGGEATDLREELLKKIDASKQQREIALSGQISETEEENREIDAEMVAKELEKERSGGASSSTVEIGQINFAYEASDDSRLVEEFE